jgi:glutamate N-acetyltransferase / amino-acid N-acetyltransferase
MAVGYKGVPALHPVAGVRVGCVEAGIKKAHRRDLVVLELAEGSRCAAVFTTNRFSAAPVRVAREHLAADDPRYLLINTGYANAGTGAQGLADARACCEALARSAGCRAAQVLPFSTGVIGEPLPVERLCTALPRALEALREDGWAEGAEGIMTTDTVPKAASRRVQIEGASYTFTGVSKGAGMIRPNMATMLAFVATDAAVAPQLLQQALSAAVAVSFNRITIDGDTSTNDACVLVATGRAGGPAIEASGAAYDAFVAALTEICTELAQQVVRDGEGATKFITVEVGQAQSTAEAEAVAYAIAHSPLVKTALFAADPNWGRILAAIGRAGIDDLDVERVQLFLGDLCIARDGARAADYEESAAATRMAEDELVIRVQLGRGTGSATVWTCDLSYDYVRINADYRS